MNIALIEDAADIRLCDYRNVPDPELVERRGIFVAEGRLVVRRLLLDSPLATRSVLVTEPGLEALSDAIRQRSDVPVFVVPQSLMSDITGFHIHRGCLAIGERPQPADWRSVAEETRVIVALERVANADNVGGVFRNVAAFGAGAVLLDPVSTDPLYRKAIRTSMGSALTVPFARIEPWPEAIEEMKQRGIATMALTPSASAQPLADIAKTVTGRPVAIILGHEGEGLTPSALLACEYRARIPMMPGADSLNVATAAGIALYEVRRAG